MMCLVHPYDPKWTLSLSAKDQQELLRQILIFEILITKIEGKFKLSQNRSKEDQANVAEIRKKSASQSDRETAEFMTMTQMCE